MLKTEADPCNPIVTFAIGLDTFGSCKLPTEGDKDPLLDVLLPMGKSLPDINWSSKSIIKLIIGLVCCQLKHGRIARRHIIFLLDSHQ